MLDTTETLLDWLAIDSTSGRESAFLETLESHFASNGWRCRRQHVQDDRWNLWIDRGKPSRFVYSTHVDTVPPFIPGRLDDDTIYGRGACDTKGGIVAMTAAGERLLADGLDEFGYLFVVGEEVDHCGAKRARALDIETDRIILCEPTENCVVAAQKGMIKFHLRTDGIAGHSAYPERGESAVHKLLAALGRMLAEDWPTHEVLGPTTINVGIIEGGVAANVFAPSAHAEVLVRTVSETAPLLARIRDVLGEDVAIEVPASNDPVFFDPPADVETMTVSFNTDATYLSEIASVWLVGPGDIQVAHSDHEHIAMKDLAAGIDLYEQLGRLAYGQ